VSGSGDGARRIPRFWGLHAEPGGGLRIGLAVLPFLLLALVYGIASFQRHQDNPADKVLPTATQMVAAVERMAFTADARTGDVLLWKDTASSLKRLAIGLGIAALLGLLVGLNMGIFAGMQATVGPFVTFLSMIPPLAILPILFISLGVGELSKVALIVIGVAPVIARDVAGYVAQIPREQVTKALTLGATQLGVVWRVLLPQVWPRLIEALRLSLGAAWLFLIAAEAIASDDGLGYRIFLVRRYLAMDVILPYVLWITLLGFLMDWALRLLLAKGFPWYVAGRKA
jgi:NitT/TauT family transport system permease protein